ncbi:efflux RND transporter periplasmic adaptor subunit [Thermotalea metallivorans]|uniref:Macrolide export protein MacA n=1 Tax=Thermotalea metallivorans TaxID=520762 RepID=A0A140LEH0_9FIRM|nr:efflux RND transporter periplasmic adaptor subunit [Thermotalea metallivorans]KXG78945.1 Macrolide export protein MacA [Thermotalea metallivorans]
MNKKFSLFLAVILLLTFALTGCGTKAEITVEEKPIAVETAKVAKKDILVKTTLTGTIKAVEEAKIVPKIPGKVVEVNVEMGDRVQKGDVLFVMEQQDAIGNVEQLEAAYQISTANLKKAQEQMDNAKTNYERMKALYEQGAISKQQFEQYELQASETNLEVLNAQVEQSRIALENARTRLADYMVTAPISGVVTAVHINPGEMASSAVPAITMANTDQVLIETSVSEHLINKVHVGDIVDILVKSASQDYLQGKIIALSPAPSSNSLTYPVKIAIENADQAIKPGMFAEVLIVSEKKENVISIPSDAVVIREGEPIVFTITDGRAKLNKVSIGLDNGSDVEIIKGIQEGDRIVVKGQNYLDEGSKVNVIK